jgi:hypothetical protein
VTNWQNSKLGTFHDSIVCLFHWKRIKREVKDGESARDKTATNDGFDEAFLFLRLDDNDDYETFFSRLTAARIHVFFRN